MSLRPRFSIKTGPLLGLRRLVGSLDILSRGLATLLPVQAAVEPHLFYTREKRHQLTGAESIADDSRPVVPDGMAQVQRIGFDKCTIKRIMGHMEADLFTETLWREVMLRDLGDVEAEFHAAVSDGRFFVSDHGPILRIQVGKSDSRRRIDRLRVADAVAHIVRKRTDCKRQLIGISRGMEEGDDEVATADVVSQVG